MNTEQYTLLNEIQNFIPNSWMSARYDTYLMKADGYASPNTEFCAKFPKDHQLWQTSDDGLRVHKPKYRILSKISKSLTGMIYLMKAEVYASQNTGFCPKFPNNH